MSSQRVQLFLVTLTCTLNGFWIQSVQADEFSKFSVSASEQSSEYYSGSAFALDWDRRDDQNDHLLLGVRTTTRDYTNGGPNLTDNGVALGYVKALSPHAYVESGATASPNANFSPLDSFSVMPHWVDGSSDYGVGVSYAQYKALVAGTVHPAYLYELGRWTLGMGGFVTRTYDYVVSESVTAKAQLSPRQILRIDYATGRTIEDQGVETHFHNTSLEYQYKLSDHWQCGLFGALYRGDIRSENSLGFKIEAGL